jgi:hypothetical protein
MHITYNTFAAQRDVITFSQTQEKEIDFQVMNLIISVWLASGNYSFSVLLNAHLRNEINSIAALTNYYRFRKEYLVNLMPYFERSIEGFFSMRMCALCELLFSLISFFNSIIFRALVMLLNIIYNQLLLNLLSFMLGVRYL